MSGEWSFWSLEKNRPSPWMNPCTRRNVDRSSLENTNPLPLKDIVGAGAGGGAGLSTAADAGEADAGSAGASGAGSEYENEVNNTTITTKNHRVLMSFSWSRSRYGGTIIVNNV